MTDIEALFAEAVEAGTVAAFQDLATYLSLELERSRSAEAPLREAIHAALVVDHTEWEPERVINGMRLALLAVHVSPGKETTDG